MKNLLFLLAVAVFSCSRPQPDVEPFPNHLIEEEDWIVYEGTLPSSHGPDVHVELSLFPGAPGLDSRYHMNESYPNTVSPKEYGGWIGSVGRYVVLFSPDVRIIHISDRTFIRSISMRGESPMPDFGCLSESSGLRDPASHERRKRNRRARV